MIVDILALQSFYRSPLGEIAQRYVGRAIEAFLRDSGGERLLGLGYASPYLAPAVARAERVLSLMPARQGVGHWPSEHANAAALANPLMLPLPDEAIDRVFVAHLLETTEDPEELLYEIWRALRPGGRLLIVVPNRRGLWALTDSTPFGQGRPYSRSQLKYLLRRTLFTPEKWAETLYVPPLASRTLLRTAGIWEKVGTRLSLPFSGVHVVEATKQMHRPLEVRRTRRKIRFAPVLAPASAPAAAPRATNVAAAPAASSCAKTTP
jgi:SAM-dependent methyltransferase